MLLGPPQLAKQRLVAHALTGTRRASSFEVKLWHTWLTKGEAVGFDFTPLEGWSWWQGIAGTASGGCAVPVAGGTGLAGWAWTIFCRFPVRMLWNVCS